MKSVLLRWVLSGLTIVAATLFVCMMWCLAVFPGNRSALPMRTDEDALLPRKIFWGGISNLGNRLQASEKKGASSQEASTLHRLQAISNAGKSQKKRFLRRCHILAGRLLYCSLGNVA